MNDQGASGQKYEARPADYFAFDEAAYLQQNGDVADAVARGEFESGRAHWEMHGRAEIGAGLRADFTAKIDYVVDSPTRDPLHGIANRRRAARKAGIALFERPFGVNFYAPLTARNGLGTLARGYYAALQAAQIPVDCFNIEWTQEGVRTAKFLTERAGRYRINLIQANASEIHHIFALFPEGQFDDGYNIAIWAWELSAFPAGWHGEFLGIDEVWGISDFTSRSIEAIAPVPVRTIHPVVQPAPRRAPARESFGLPRDLFLFLCVFDLASYSARKNPLAAIAAFQRAFSDHPGAGLVLKFHSANHELDTEAEFVRLQGQIANLYLIGERISAERLADLRASVDCVISPHRAEGFGFNLAEAMAEGIPVIATGYSGNVDFMDWENSLLIDYRLAEIPATLGPYSQYSLWAEPDIGHLAALMRQVREQPGPSRQRAARAVERIMACFSPTATGAAMQNRFSELQLDAERPYFLSFYGKVQSRITDPFAWPQQEFPPLAHRPIFSLVLSVEDPFPGSLGAWIESVCAQTYPGWEICLIDNGTTDRVQREATEFWRGRTPNFRILRLTERCSKPAATALAIEMSSGDFIYFAALEDPLAPDLLMALARDINGRPDGDNVTVPGGIPGQGPFPALVMRKSTLLGQGDLPQLLSALLTRQARAV